MAEDDNQCRFVSRCPMFPRFKSTQGLEIFQTTYCHSANHTRCRRYELASEGEMPDPDLLPNGRRLAN